MQRARPDGVVVIAEQLRRQVPGGIGTYVRGLLTGLDKEANVTLVASRGPRTDPLAQLGFPVHTSVLPGPLLTRVWDRGLGCGVPPTRLVHGTSLATPYPRDAKITVMVHDLAWREVPDAFPSRGRRWHEAALARCVKHASVVIAPSERTASMIEGARAVEIIPEGCDHLPPADQAGADRLLKALDITTPFVLSVSTLEPRKNLARLLTAYERAGPDFPEPWPLLVVGPTGWGPTLAPTASAKLAGHVTDAVLAALYAAARCVVYVPLVEGWGLPAVEAMAACTPVVASPMPSTAGAALEVDPRSEEAIAAGIVVAASDERERSRLVTAGLLRAGELTWANCAARHVEVWEQVA
jgi:glycosyltransferase involved in cell wall biosynthesis